MKKIILTLVLIVATMFCVQATYANDKLIGYLGVTAEAGYSNLFFSPFNSSDISYRPLPGGGFGGAFTFDFEYKKFLFQTGLGVTYTFNQNFFHFENKNPLSIIPTPGMKFLNADMTEQTTHLFGYVPIKLGMKWQRWYFLAGAKVGIFSMGGKSRSLIDMTMTSLEEANDANLSYKHFTSDYEPFAYNHLNAILSAEIGLDINKQAWKEDPKQSKEKMDAAQRYREAKRKKSLAELTHYRVALFVDYGLNNLQNAELNYRPIGADAYRSNRLNNFMAGVKVTFNFELPQSKPKGNPYVYLYVKDESTEKPIPGATVQMQRKGTKSISKKTTDTKRGRVARALLPGLYWAKVSHSRYCPIDTIHFVHNDDYDTLRVSLHPRHTFRIPVVDANTSKPIQSNGQFIPVNRNPSISIATDPTGVMVASLDDRIGYIIKIQANGYYDYCDTIDAMSDELIIKMQPLLVKKQTFILQNMHFATAQTDILPISNTAMDLLYKLLNENSDLCIRIVGHTDDVGSDDDNRILSEGRANSIRQEMIKRGISATRMEVLGKGETEPIVPNDSEEHRQMNRRVEIEILSGADNINIEQLAQ